MSDSGNVLVVDDQESFREAVAFEFELLGFNTLKAKDGYEAFKIFETSTIDLIISDVRMPNWDGLKLLQAVRQKSKVIPSFILMTGFADLKTYEAYNEGADAFIGKPFKPEILAEVVATVLKSGEKEFLKTSDILTSFDIKVDISDKKQFRLGRRGFFLGSESIPDIRELSPGDSISFDIKNAVENIEEFIGVGKVLWTRSEVINSLPPGIGVQINYLQEISRQEFLKSSERTEVAVIPIGITEQLDKSA